jgi:restriction endonuclease Mrr
MRSVTGAKPLQVQIVLIDGVELATLMIRHKVGTRVVATVDIQEADGAFFGD